MSGEPKLPSENDALARLVTECILAFERDGADAVQAMLASHPDLAPAARQQLDALRDAGLLVPPAPDPDQVGPYRILRRLGTGGVGTVYLAQQNEPVQRQVAIKVIRPGMDTREVLARFAVERQALALLEHPNVARVLDAGMTADERPFLCMDFVPGQPITRYCDERALDLPARIDLLATVCDAIQAAHQKGILHRDLKPSNILVSDRDGGPAPTVIDFGVAKSLGPRLLDVTLLTAHRGLVGTLEYMSPEQAANEVDVDTRTDVHALGVMLYELLTGCLPFPSERLRRADTGELVRILREETPPRPSAVVTERPDAGRRAQLRGHNPATLQRALRRELDWIVQRAIEKDRNRRYGMAAELASDLRRYLSGDAVHAGPPNAWYRWRKMLGRYRYQASSAAAVVLALVGGLVTSVTFYSDAHAKSVQSAASLDVALDAVERMVQAGEDRLNIVPHMDEVRRELLREALELQRRLAASTGEERLQRRTARALAGLAKVQAELGDIEQALDSSSEALAMLGQLPTEMRGDTAELALRTRLHFQQFRWSETLPHSDADGTERIERATKLADELLQRPDIAPDQTLLASQVFVARALRFSAGEVGTADELFSRVAALLEPMLADPVGHRERLPAALRAMSHFARFCMERGDIERGIALGDRLHEIVVAEFERNDDVIRRAGLLPALESIGSVWYHNGKYGRVVRELQPAIGTYRMLARYFPAVPHHREKLARALVQLALAREWTADIDPAIENSTEAAQLLAELVREYPESREYRAGLLWAYTSLAHHAATARRLMLEADWTESDRAIALGLELARHPAFTAEPGTTELERLAEFHRVRGIVAGLRDRHEEAAAAHREALHGYRKLARQTPDALPHQQRIADVDEKLSQALVQLGRHAEAAPLLEDAIRRLSPLRGKLGHERGFDRTWRRLHGLQASVWIARGQFERAWTALDAIAEMVQADNDWILHDLLARLACEGALRAPAASAWRERFAGRCRDEIEAAIEMGRSMPMVSPVTIAVMASRSLHRVVELERGIGDLEAAIATQDRIVHGYMMAFDSKASDRNRERAAAGLRLLVELQEEHGDATGATATRKRLERMLAQ